MVLFMELILVGFGHEVGVGLDHVLTCQQGCALQRHHGGAQIRVFRFAAVFRS